MIIVKYSEANQKESKTPMLILFISSKGRDGGGTFGSNLPEGFRGYLYQLNASTEDNIVVRCHD